MKIIKGEKGIVINGEDDLVLSKNTNFAINIDEELIDKDMIEEISHFNIQGIRNSFKSKIKVTLLTINYIWR